ncbi:hypothetical protein G5C51_36250 [Streptomyces sp. A7024]|uniref:Uncharacterized protein n=1 Tax=Streptomyces coryli TaxID=1128680 RepID=A0A6G4UCC4_9ACTN|nr:hypothetical protein [Streptomyces coryli]NGN69326.1 hypothetical protein [Streptomyces coryli]
MTDSVIASRGVSRSVVGAALATAAGVTPGLLGMSSDVLPTGALYGLGWPAFGVASALLLDRDALSRLGRVFASLALLPAAVSAVALPAVPAADDGQPGWSRIERCWEWLGIAPIVAALAVIAWGMDTAADRMSRRRLVWLVVWSSALVVSVLTASFGGDARVVAAVTTLGLWGRPPRCTGSRRSASCGRSVNP